MWLPAHDQRVSWLVEQKLISQESTVRIRGSQRTSDAEPTYMEIPRGDTVLALWFLDTLSYLDCLTSTVVRFQEHSSDSADIPRDLSPKLQSMLVY